MVLLVVLLVFILSFPLSYIRCSARIGGEGGVRYGLVMFGLASLFTLQRTLSAGGGGGGSIICICRSHNKKSGKITTWREAENSREWPDTAE